MESPTETPEPRFIAFGDFVLDLQEHTLLTPGEPRYLTPKTFDTLHRLLANAGETVPKGQLLQDVWPDAVVGENALTRVVKELRQALDDDARNPRYIETVPRVGYRFLAEARYQAASERRPRSPGPAPVDEARQSGRAEADTRAPAASRPPAVEPKSRRWPLVLVLVLLGVVAAGLLWRTPPSRPSPATDAGTGPSLLAPDVDPDAWLEYTQGRELINARSEAERRRAVAHFRRAIERDPDFAEAYSGLADALIALTTFLPPRAILPEAVEATRRALELDPANVDARISMAQLESDYLWDFAAAERSFRQAMTQEPDSLAAYLRYAEFLGFRNREADALELLEEARERHPLAPQPVAVSGWLHTMEGDTDRARQALAKALAMDPDLVITHLNLGLLALREAEYGKAAGHFESAIEHGGPSPDLEGLLGYAAARDGQTARAETVLERLSAWQAERYVAPIGPAMVYLGLGEHQAAIEALEAAVGDRIWHVVMLEHHFLFDPLRSDPAFQALVDTIGEAGASGEEPSATE